MRVYIYKGRNSGELENSRLKNRKSRKIQRTNRCQLKDRNFAARQRTDKKEWDS